MNKYDKMDYSQFIEHLTKNNIEYEENSDIDIWHWADEYIEVIPLGSRLKARFFTTDGGSQLLT